nr:hypothetical protein [Tanacetum cinerariifolium]
ATRHFKRDCPKLKNKDDEKVNAPGWVYAVGNVKKRGNASRDPDSNFVTDMSKASSAVTYTSVYTDSEPVAPPSPDYIPGLEEPQTPPAPQDEDEHELMFIQSHDPNFVPEPIYLEYIPLEDEHILPAEEQPLPPAVLPIAESPGYVAESDPEEDPEEYAEDEAEDGPDEDNEDEEEEEEHVAPANSAIVIPIDELVSPHEGTKPTIPPPSTDTTTIGGERLARCTAPAALPSPSLPPFSYLPPPVDRRDGIPESKQPPRKRICLSTLSSRCEVGESSTRGRGVDYGFADTVEAEMRDRGM